MRLVLIGTILALLAPFPARAADVEFVRVWPAWRDATAFESIAEYFGGGEQTGGRIVLRTEPAVRSGFYFLVRVSNSGDALPGAHFALQVITPASAAPKTYAFPANLPHRSAVYQLGLTGAAWPDRKVHPVAWKLELLAADERVLASAQSFLWEKPSK